MNKVHYLVRKQGVPALAYAASDVSLLWPCTLRILYVELYAQFMVSLESDVAIQGVDDKQPVSLRFDGHNLMPGKGSLGPVHIQLTAAMRNSVARPGSPQVSTLSLVLQTPCAVWLPRKLSAEASSIDNLSHALAALVRTTEVHIVVDVNWLGLNLGQLQSAVEGSQQLAGVPVHPASKLAQSHQQALWSVYKLDQQAPSRVAPSVEDLPAAAPPSIEDAQDDAPPAYARVSSKRSRQSKSSSLISRGYC